MSASQRGNVLVGLLTGCQDRPYAFGMAVAVAAEGVAVEVVGNRDSDTPELHTTRQVRVLDFKGIQRNGGALVRVWSLLAYYGRLIRYALKGQPRVLHILWNNRLQYFDRTLLMLYYKLRGKKIVLTAHNVNQGKRDGNDSFLNRLTLTIQYRLVDHIFVHTAKMRDELVQDFGVRQDAVTIINHPINNAFPDTDLTPAEARRRLGLGTNDKVLLFLGRIRPYKGLEFLLSAFREMKREGAGYRLVVAGEPKTGSEDYFQTIVDIIQRDFAPGEVLLHDRFIPDDEIEVFLKASDVLVLPYKDISQSGILFLAHTYGLPAIAADVGAFSDTIIDGQTGFLFQPQQPADLVRAVESYFASDLYAELDRRRAEVREYFAQHYSWHAVGSATRRVYEQLTRP
jgi:D-inositol-3-phosphate glycosyltransferase